MVNYVKGNLLESNCDYICHQVNCQGVMASGIAKQIREKWPIVYEAYKDRVDIADTYGRSLLGRADFVLIPGSRYVINMFCQDKYGYNGGRYTSYDAFARALYGIKVEVREDATIGFPKNIGCGLGGGNWKVISALIEEILGETHEVYIYEWEG